MEKRIVVVELRIVVECPNNTSDIRIDKFIRDHDFDLELIDDDLDAVDCDDLVVTEVETVDIRIPTQK